MTMGRLANHIAEVPGWAPAFLSSTEFDMQPAEGGPPTPEAASTVAGILEKLDGGVKTARELIAATSDADFAAPWTLKKAGQDIFTQPRFGVFRRWFLNHLVHHRAQLGVYLRLNEVAVPQTLGPTADESDF